MSLWTEGAIEGGAIIYDCATQRQQNCETEWSQQRDSQPWIYDHIGFAEPALLKRNPARSLPCGRQPWRVSGLAEEHPSNRSRNEIGHCACQHRANA